MNKFPERLKIAMEASGVKGSALAKKLNVSPGAVTNWRTGINHPDAVNLKLISVLLNCSQGWLLGEGSSDFPNENANTKPAELPKVVRMVPVISWAKAGEMVDYQDLDAQIDESIPCETKDQNAFALEIEGDSMEPRFCAGDRIVLAPNAEPRNGELVGACLVAGGVLFKKYRTIGRDGLGVRLESLNENYSPVEKKREDFRWIYPVISVQINPRR